MAKGRQKRKPRQSQQIDQLDATPERIAKDDSTFVETKAENSARTVKTRRFASSKLDRLYRANQISFIEHYAGDWYRTRAEECKTGGSVISGYGQGIGGGVKFYAFLPRTTREIEAANALRQARAQMPLHMQGFMDRLLIHDDLPRYGGRQAMRTIAQIRLALGSLATWLRAG